MKDCPGCGCVDDGECLCRPSVPVGVMRLLKEARQPVNTEDGCFSPSVAAFADKIEAALTAPPSAPVGVEGLVGRMLQAPSRLWMADLVGQRISVERMRDILAFALAQQPAAVDGATVHKAIRKARNIADGAEAHPSQGPKHADGMRRACNVIEAALAAQPAAVDGYTTGHCERNKQPGGCDLNNLSCGWPACDRRPTAAQEEDM